MPLCVCFNVGFFSSIFYAEIYSEGCFGCVVYAAISSLSLSLLATAIDSVFDIGSNVVLYYLHNKASQLDVNKWPVGGSRLETIGNIIYGMSTKFVYNGPMFKNSISQGHCKPCVGSWLK